MADLNLRDSLEHLEKLFRNPAAMLKDFQKMEKQLMSDPKNRQLLPVYIKFAEDAGFLSGNYITEGKFNDALKILDRVSLTLSFLTSSNLEFYIHFQGENVLKCLPPPYIEGNFIYLLTIYTRKVQAFLGLRDIENAKKALITAKEYCDKIGQTDEEMRIDCKNTLYRTYFEYFSHELVNNMKKSIINFAGWFKGAWKCGCHTFDYFLQYIFRLSNVCMKNYAFRQNEYILRVGYGIIALNKEKMEKSQIENFEMDIMAQEILHITRLLSALKKSSKLNDYCETFNFHGVPNDSNALMSGLIDDPNELGGLFVKAKKLMFKLEKLFTKRKNLLVGQNFYSANGKIDACKNLLKNVKEEYGFTD